MCSASLTFSNADFFSGNAAPRTLLRGDSRPLIGRCSRRIPTVCCRFQAGRKESAATEELKGRSAILGIDHALYGCAAALDGLVAEGHHSNKSPEETRRISSSEVMPIAAFRKAS